MLHESNIVLVASVCLSCLSVCLHKKTENTDQQGLMSLGEMVRMRIFVVVNSGSD